MSTPHLRDIPLDAKVAFLKQASSYTEPTYRVEAIETHMSWVFLTDSYAYKLKKPVRYDHLDFAATEVRRHYCEEEVRLNRRLAPHIYIGTVALSVDEQCHLQLGSAGKAVDWLVKMNRLPAQHMLDFLLLHGKASEVDMRRIAERLAGFYKHCVPLEIAPAAYCRGFAHGIEQNLAQLGRPAYGLDQSDITCLCEAQRRFIDACAARLAERARQGRIIEGHGDLRPEHICIGDDIQIIDCLEFSRDLRIVDPLDELGFLALECERLGAPELGTALLEFYRTLAGDGADEALSHFYRSYRATVRALITIRHLDEPKFRHSPEWRNRTNTYLALARDHQASFSSVIDSSA